MITLSLLPLMLLMTSICLVPTSQTQTPTTATVIATFDPGKDRTTVRMVPVQISVERGKYHSLHMSPSFSFPGHQYQRPSIIDFELQTVVKVRLLDTDLYVVFIVDGETIFLSSNRSVIARPVPGRRWMVERLVFRMPYDTFTKLTKAKTVEIRFDDVKFSVAEPQLGTLREFAKQMN